MQAHYPVVIADIVIRQNADGLYCLNDLHIASGGLEKHKPSNWSRRKETIELTEEISHCSDMRSGLHIINGGSNRGTYGCKELVYAYAMWISPKFNLHVIRTFDALVTAQYQQAAGGEFAQGAFKEFQMTRLELVQTVADMTEAGLKVANLMGLEGNEGRFWADKAVVKQIGIGPLEILGIKALPGTADEIGYTPSQLGERFNVSAQQFNKLLESASLQVRTPKGQGGPSWMPTDKGKPHAKFVDTGKAHHSGKAVTQLLWKESVLEVLRDSAKEMSLLIRPVVRG